MWSDAARTASAAARGGQGAAQGGALQAGLAAAGATSRGAWSKGKTGKQPTQKVIITGDKPLPPTGGSSSTDGAAHQRGVNAIQPHMGSRWAGNVATNAYANGSRPLVPTGDGGYRYQKFDD